MFCAGPLSKIIIPKCMMINPNNMYLDVGSTLDVFLKGTQYQRSYVNIHCPYNHMQTQLKNRLLDN